MEGHDTDIGVATYGFSVVETLGVVVLHIESHWPSYSLLKGTVESLYSLRIACLAEEHRVGDNVILGLECEELLAQRKEVYGHHIGLLPLARRDECWHLLFKRRAVAQNSQTARGVHIVGTCTHYIVTEILLHGHRRKED